VQQYGVNILDGSSGEPFSPDLPSEELLEAAFDAINLQGREDWIVDSGALAYFSGEKSSFSTIDSSHQKSVTSAGGQSHCIEGQGVAEISLTNGEIKTIRDVQYVPGLYRNILSVGKIADLGHMALFDQSSCFVISKEKPFRIIAKGVRTPGSGLYRLIQLTQNLDSAPQVHSLADSSENSTANPSHRESDLHLSQLWHSRLGHVNFQSLNILNPKNLVRGFPAFKVVPQTCVACQKGKQTRERFPHKSTSRTTTPLVLVHTDICGPLPVPSLARSEYFILFTDDFSRKSWIYFLRTKDQALEKFQLFRNMIEKQTMHKILALRSDRGGEFLSEAFSHYLHDHGIVRQLTTAHTPSQNGVSERKNRTILNMVRAMLIAGHVPKFLWTEAAHTAVQLLNSLPTKSNNGTTPEEHFSGIKPDLSLYRIFGCLTFVHKHKSQRDKLTSRSFLGI
jgi:transposase InsO family protein